jgi:hypothetical protein
VYGLGAYEQAIVRTNRQPGQKYAGVPMQNFLAQ